MNPLKNIRNFDAQSMRRCAESLIEWGSVMANLHAPDIPFNINSCVLINYANPVVEKDISIVGFCAYIPIND